MYYPISKFDVQGFFLHINLSAHARAHCDLSCGIQIARAARLGYGACPHYYLVTPLNFQIVMEDIEDPLASNSERPRVAEPTHVPQKVPLSPPAPTTSPAASSQQQNDQTGREEEKEEMEVMDEDELEFLEGNAQLGILRSGMAMGLVDWGGGSIITSTASS